MNNKEKYYNYIVDDMVKKTKIDFDRYVIHHPIPDIAPHSIYFRPSLSNYFYYSAVYKYLKETYGVKEDEVGVIWGSYYEKIYSLIKN